MKLTSVALAAAFTTVSAFAVNAEMIENKFSGEITSMYAVHEDGSRDNVQDENCISSLGNMFMGKEITGQYKIDTTKEMGEGTLSFEGETLELTPFKMGDMYGLATVAVGDKLSGMYVEAIHVVPSAEEGASRAEVLVQQEGQPYNCVAATHGPQG